jgi:hypothetical protein
MHATLVSLLLSCAAATAPGEPRLLNSFETPADVAALQNHGVRLESIARGATDGKQALRVSFLDGEYPNIQAVAREPWDWAAFGALALDMTNPGSEPLEFGIRVDDDLRADGIKFCCQAGGRIEPGQSMTIALPLAEAVDPMKYGMRGLPPAHPEMHALQPYSAKPINLHHVVAWQVFMHRPQQPAVLILDNVRLVEWRIPLDGIVDEFGQYAKADWPGKLKDVSGFAARRSAEEADLKAHPAPPDRDKYGGYTKAPARRATGFFRTEKIDGKWWLITPDGHVFFSTGMDCVTLWNATITTGREQMFAWLPDKTDPLARHAGRFSNIHSGPVKQGADFNFFTCNLERKFGRDYEQPWFDEAITRLLSWGFNTIGNWSDQRLYGNGRIPYVATTGIGGPHRRISSGSDYWGKMHDPFDPQFRQDTADAIRGLAARIKDDPWCIGWFVDNELSWGGWGDDNGRYGLALGSLAEPGDCHAKNAILSQLKTKYGQIGKLNEAWGANFADWAALQKPYKPSGQLSSAMKADLAAFVRDFARQYFRVVRDELHKADPNHLYLGCRFAWHTPEAVAAAAEICDVVSFNIYQPRLDPAKLPALKTFDKPCIIGEFHFGALDRGMFHTGLVSTPNQKARAAMYQDYLRSVAEHPNFVGCHWFQYVDEPLTGRSFDGENYEIGFVTVTDTPYPEMIEAARAVHAEIYPRR